MAGSRIFGAHFIALGIVLSSGLSIAASPSAVHCTLNAAANRSYDEKLKWVGPIPKWGQAPDTSAAFDIVTGAEATSERVLFSGFIFSQLETQTPHIRMIPSRLDSKGVPMEGYERSGAVIHRSQDALFFQWAGAADEFYTAVIHFGSRKAAITSVSTGVAHSVGVTARTADCQ
jgi:hypothetical protein